MSIVFFGTPDFAVPSFKALIRAGEKIGAVVTKKDKPKGRSRAPSPPPVKKEAIAHGLKVLQPSSMKDGEFIDELHRIRPEFVVVVAFGKILPKIVLELPSIAPVNVHASLLPRWRGASPIAWAILSGDKETGVTTMLIAEGLDEGDVLLMEKTPITDEDNSETLGMRLSHLGASLLVKTLKGLRENAIKPLPQRGEPTFAPRLKKEDGLINWGKTARELFNFTRAMYPWPCAYCYMEGERIKILKAMPFEEAMPPGGKGTPGRIEKAGRDSLIIGTGGGLISLVELQPEGKRPMPIKAFLQGRSLKEGAFVDGV